METDYIPIHRPCFVLAQESADDDCRMLGMMEVIDEVGVITHGAIHIQMFVDAIADIKGMGMLDR